MKIYLKKALAVACYAGLAIVLALSIRMDRSAFAAKQEDIQNRAGYPPVVSQMSPSFSVTRLPTGETMTERDLLGGGRRILVFSIPNCPMTGSLLDALLSLGIEDVGVVFFDVSAVERPALEKYVEAYPELAFYLEAGHSVAWSYKVQGSPTMYLYDAEGRIVLRSIGLMFGSPWEEEDPMEAAKAQILRWWRGGM